MEYRLRCSLARGKNSFSGRLDIVGFVETKLLGFDKARGASLYQDYLYAISLRSLILECFQTLFSFGTSRLELLETLLFGPNAFLFFLKCHLDFSLCFRIEFHL